MILARAVAWYRAGLSGFGDPPVGGGAVPLDVGAQQRDEVGRDRDGPCLVGRAILRAAFLAGGAVVGPAPSGAGGGGGQVDPPPAVARQVQVTLAENDRLRRAQRGVVQAG